MKSKSKRPDKRSGRDPKPTESPFYRPFASISGPALRKEPASPTEPAPVRVAAPTPNRNAQPTKRVDFVDPSVVDDATTFERFMSGVEPLSPTNATRISRTQSQVESGFAQRAQTFVREREVADQEALRKLHSLVHDGSRFEVNDDGHRIEGRRRGADGGTIRKMRNGELSVDATLDLFGMHLFEAREAVEAFVRDRRMKGDRVLLIQHGDRRGPYAGGGSGPAGQSRVVLRGEIAAWLSEGDASTHVSAFMSAPAEFGDEAISVLLAQPSDTHRGMG